MNYKGSFCLLANCERTGKYFSQKINAYKTVLGLFLEKEAQNANFKKTQ